MKKKIINNQKELGVILRGVGDEQRLKLLCVLFKEKSKCVTSLAKETNLNIASTSHHLRTLYGLGLLEIKREGKNICYSLKSEPLLKDLKKIVCKYINN